MLKLILNLSPVQKLVASFALIILTGALLLHLSIAGESGKAVSFIDALFTSTSATCVTGLIVVDTPTAYSTFGEVVIVFLIQFGGIGIITFGVVFFVLMGYGISYRNKLILKESFATKGSGQVIHLAWSVIKLTLIIELTGTLLLTLFFTRHGFSIFRSMYLAVFHAVSAFCNAGFSLFSNNLESYNGDWGINFTIMGLIVSGGLGFPVLIEILALFQKKKLSIRSRIVLLTTAFLIFGGALLIHLFASNGILPEYQNLSADEKFLTCMFQSVTARTAGFNTINLNYLSTASIAVIILLMFIGGSPQSTAGGIKTTTFWIIVFGSWCFLRGRDKLIISRKQVSDDTFKRAVVLTTSAFILVIIAVAIIIYFNSSPLVLSRGNYSILFEVVSAFGTVGLSLGITPDLNTLQKLIIIFMMFIGRIGPLSFAFFFVTRKTKSRLEYPEVEIPIG
jgi:trk system potassium uptake protein TrkH